MTTEPSLPTQPLLAASPPPSPAEPGQRLRWTGLRGATAALALSRLAGSAPGPLLVIARDSAQAAQIERELRFFAGDGLEILEFPDWEILPYDRFSPHQDLISARLRTMSRLPHLAIVLKFGSSVLLERPNAGGAVPVLVENDHVAGDLVDGALTAAASH